MRRLLVVLVALGLFATMHAQGQAKVVVGPDIIPAPESVLDGPVGAENLGQQGFDERQCVTLAEPLAIDGGGELPAGTIVDSHMIFLNPVDDVLIDVSETWIFSTPILATMTDMSGELEAASSDVLGAPGTMYSSPFFARGLDIDFGDSFTVDGNTLGLTMIASGPGDWMRVVTAAACESEFRWGDVDCSDSVDAVDALKTLQLIAELPYTQAEPCFPLNEFVAISPAGFEAQLWADVDCTGTIAATDALATLRHVAAFSVNQQPDCPEIGEVFLIQ